SAASSARLYWESFGPGKRKPLPVTVPTGVAVYPQEIVPPVRRWMEAAGFNQIRHWQAMPRGGHDLLNRIHVPNDRLHHLINRQHGTRRDRSGQQTGQQAEAIFPRITVKPSVGFGKRILFIKVK
ncbi:MAG TPA: hypothetical protein PLZ74_07200, partial [Kiritimatiellia bacterium]|nr:hypothetical protein [Kiritimatiellia bacterium]